MINSSISVRQVEPAAERATVLQLLKDNMPEAVSKGRFDWAYLDNPCGEALVWLAETVEGDPVGTSAAFPRLFRVNGSTIGALVLSDFVVSPAFRTLGPAIALLRATLGAIDDGSYAFSLDHPSTTMAAVYKRLGGIELGRQSRFVRLLKTGGAAERRWGAGLRASLVGSVGDVVLRLRDGGRRARAETTFGSYSGQFDDEFGQLGVDAGKTRTVYGDRNKEYLNWRFRSGIRFDYRVVTVRRRSKLLAYAVVQVADSAPLTIVEFVCPATARLEDELISALIEFGRHSGSELLQASSVDGSPWCSLLRRSGFREREQGAGPFVYTSKNSELARTLNDNQLWWLTDGDRDG